MTKEITKAYIIQQIEDKFKLRELEPGVFSFSETVVPTYNIEQHLLKWEIKSSTVSITSAASFTFYTVPSNERWTLRAYTTIFGGTGAHKASGVYVGGRPVGSFMYLDLKKGQDVSYLVNLPILVTLQSGNTLKILIDDYTSTQDLTLDIDVQVEEMR